MACECRSSGDDGDGDGENDKKKREREHTFGKNAKERKETRGDKEKGGMKRRWISVCRITGQLSRNYEPGIEAHIVFHLFSILESDI